MKRAALACLALAALPAQAQSPRFATAATDVPYFVETRFTGGRACLFGRYQDPDNWLAACLSSTGTRLDAELLAMKEGKSSRIKQVTRASDGLPHTLRFDVGADGLALYVDGERLTGAAMPFVAGGRAGGFDIDPQQSGAAVAPPARIALARMTGQLKLQAGERTARLPVASALPYTASSNDPAIATAAVEAGALRIRAHAPGTAIITLASPAASVALTVAVRPASRAPAQSAALNRRVLPAPGESAVPPDTLLRLRFDRAPTIGAGAIRIVRNGVQVDAIEADGEVDTLGYAGQHLKRAVRSTLVRVDGNSIVIQPHSARLAYGARYQVAIDDGALLGTIDGKPFRGMAPRDWTFRTRASAPRGRTLRVDDDGQADFRTVQGAFNHTMRYHARATPVTIAVANGRYQELLYLRGRDHVTLRGESRDGVLIHATNNDSMNPGSGAAQEPMSPGAAGGRALMLVEDADMLTIDSLTMVNDTWRARVASAQAETLYFNSEAGRLVATSASFLSEQDTVQLKGYAWFYRTLVAGNVDFIWGYNRAALFEDSEIRSVGDSANAASGGYVVQARTVHASDPGFVFFNSRLTHGPGPAGNGVPAGATWLARSPGTIATWDNVSYINCQMEAHIAAARWFAQPAPNSGPLWGWRAIELDESAARIRQQVFQGFANGQGWLPAAPTRK